MQSILQLPVHEGLKRCFTVSLMCISTARKLTSCWCASVCFISTILMLCSMAYFLARVTASCCSWLSFGSPAPRRPGIVVFRAPGPEQHNSNVKVPTSKAYFLGIIFAYDYSTCRKHKYLQLGAGLLIEIQCKPSGPTKPNLHGNKSNKKVSI